MVAGILGVGSVVLGVDDGEDGGPVGDSGLALLQATEPVTTMTADAKRRLY